ncbi:MAG TPA: family 16 glycoside hydrolase, partial [Clostridia bacterium]
IWQVKDNKYSVNSESGAKSVVNGTDYSDLIMQAEVTPQNGGDSGIIFRSKDLSTGTDAYNGYYAGIYPSRNFAEIGRANGSWYAIKTGDYTITPGETYRLAVVARGSNLKLFLNDEPLIDLDDNSYSNGAVGVRTYYSDVSFGKFAAASLVYSKPSLTGVYTQDGNEIQAGRDYEIDGNNLTLSTGYLNSLPVGETVLKFVFYSGNPVYIHLRSR